MAACGMDCVCMLGCRRRGLTQDCAAPCRLHVSCRPLRSRHLAADLTEACGFPHTDLSPQRADYQTADGGGQHVHRCGYP